MIYIPTMIYLLGVLTGLIVAVLVVLVVKRYETPITRTIKQTESKLKPKGSILEPEAEELEEWVKTLKNETTV